MAKGGYAGPNRGGYLVVTGCKSGVTASQTNQAIPFYPGTTNAGFTFPGASRLVKIHVRVTGTGGLTKVSLRKTANQAAVPVIGDTSIVSSDTLTVAASSQIVIYPAQFSGVVPTTTTEGETLAGTTISTRDFAKGEQLGVFVDSDATVGSRDIMVTVTYFLRGHAYTTQGANEVD